MSTRNPRSSLGWVSLIVFLAGLLPFLLLHIELSPTTLAQSGGGYGSDPDSDDDEDCGDFLEGEQEPPVGETDCSGANPAGLLGTPDSKVIPLAYLPPPPTYVPAQMIPAWRGQGSSVDGPTAHQSDGYFRGPVEVPQLATNLYDREASPFKDSLSFLTSLQQGSVEVGHLGFVWGEVDRIYKGVTNDVDLVIGRRYFSRSTLNAPGSVGHRWIHSLYERLVFVDSSHIRHITWINPYNDPDKYYTAVGSGLFQGPPGRNTQILPSTAWPGASYKLAFGDGRSHYFDSSGKVLARVGRSGISSIQFSYNALGRLNAITDSRGQAYSVDDTTQYLKSITDASGSTIQYEVLSGRLNRVIYASHEIVTVSDAPTGNGLTYSRTTRATQQSFNYNAAGLLSSIRNDGNEQVIGITYLNDNTNRVQL